MDGHQSHYSNIYIQFIIGRYGVYISLVYIDLYKYHFDIHNLCMLWILFSLRSINVSTFTIMTDYEACFLMTGY